MKILVVDDCQTTRKLIGFYLKSKGFEVVFAENGVDAIEKLASNPVSLILTEINMPYMDGIEFVKNIRNDKSLVNTPIIVVTTEAGPEEREKAYAAGANGYLIKPITADTVSQNIESLVKDSFSKKGGA